MGDHSYNDFMNSTGFGGGPSSATPGQSNHVGTPSTKPMSSGEGAARARQFAGEYNTMNAPVGRPAPNSLPQGRHEVQGVVSKQEYPSGPPVRTPYAGPVVGGADARTGGHTNQNTWQAVGVGPSMHPPTLARHENEDGVAPAPPVNRTDQLYMVGGAVCGLGFVVSLSKWNDAKRVGYSGSKYWGVSALIFALLACTAGYKYANMGPIVEGQQGRVRIGTSRLIPESTLPRQRDQRDVTPHPVPSDVRDSMGQRMAQNGVNPGEMEGPRGNYGYQRGPVTAEDRKRLNESELMRTARYHNMDKGTFDEYMARLDGEAPNQFVQAHPYMPFAAQWDKRSEIDDASKQFGIGTSPGPANRKFKYKDPRMQQAGARTMHTKNPPPGSVPPLERTHPWLEHDASGEEPAVLLGAEVSNHEKLTAQDTSRFVKERMAESANLDELAPSADKDFLKTYEMDKKKPQELPQRPSYQPSGPPPTGPIDLEEQREKRQNHTFEPVRYEETPIPRDQPVDQIREKVYYEQPQEEQQYYEEEAHHQNMNHRVGDKAPPQSTPEDSFAASMLHSGFDGDDSGGSGSFESMFAEKKQPTESDVKQAQMNQRRAE